MIGGTTQAIPLKFRTDNTDRIEISATGTITMSGGTATALETYGEGIRVSRGDGGAFSPRIENGADGLALVLESDGYEFRDKAGNTRLSLRVAGQFNASNLPTSSTGLSAGDVWNDAGTLKIV